MRTISGYRTAAAVMLALATTIGLAAGAQATTAPASSAWQENLAQPVTATNLAHPGGALRIADPHEHPAAQAGASGYGMAVFAPHALRAPVGSVAATVTDTVPRGARVILDVRGQLPDHGWTEWTSSATGAPVALRSAASVIQVRLTLWDNAAGQSPTVTAVHLTGVRGASSHVDGPAAPAQESYQVYATREGLVGGTTANGHVIVDNDHFVALPSGTALSPQGSDDYSVQVCGPSACETAPVWDIGPWNEQDNYWDADRNEFTDLDQGTPEAQAAYDDGYNNGLDDLGTTVLNPAGIDLADGTFYDVGLNDNGYVTVTYLWT